MLEMADDMLVSVSVFVNITILFADKKLLKGSYLYGNHRHVVIAIQHCFLPDTNHLADSHRIQDDLVLLLSCSVLYLAVALHQESPKGRVL